MIKKIRHFINFLLAKDEDIELEQRILIIAAFAGVGLASLGTIVNSIIAVGIIAKLLPLLALGLISFLYYKTRFGKNIGLYSVITYFISIVLVFIISIFNGGVESGNIVTLILVMVIGTIILPSKFKLSGLLLFLLLIFLLFYIDYFYPHNITHFSNRQSKYLDIFIATLYSSFSLYYLIYYLYKNYYNEHNLLKIKEENLKTLNKQLSDSISTKEKFYSIIAHDLRNPINNFHLTTNLLLEEYDVVSDEEKKEFITMIRDSSKDLQEMLEILLSLVKINQGILPITIRNINLNKLLINNIDFLRLQAINKDIELVNNYSGDLDVQVDKSYLDIILRNLLSNSLKFTNPKGKIVIDVDENYIDENITGKNISDKNITGEFLKVTIEDNGIGIPENIKAQIFHFDKLITSVGINKEAGNGLGLLLCKEFVEKMGGKIWFESEENKGTKFFFTLRKQEKI